jgi:hypothetical protein
MIGETRNPTYRAFVVRRSQKKIRLAELAQAAAGPEPVAGLARLRG